MQYFSRGDVNEGGMQQARGTRAHKADRRGDIVAEKLRLCTIQAGVLSYSGPQWGAQLEEPCSEVRFGGISATRFG